VALRRCGHRLCPGCGPRLALARVQEIEATVAAHVAAGGSVAMVTFTLRHYLHMPLEDSVKAVRAGWSAVTASNRGWREDRKQAGIAGFVKAIETTYGGNGWHHHLHLLLLLDADPEDVADALAEPANYLHADFTFAYQRGPVIEAMFDRWAAAVVASGMPAPSRERGIHVTVPAAGDEAAQAAVVAAYVAKLDYALGSGSDRLRAPSGDRRRADQLGWELAYGAHGKRGKNGSRTPLQIALDAIDESSPSRAQSAALWHEYLTATAGMRSFEWSRDSRDWPDIRRLYATRDDRTDEEILDHRETGAEGIGYVVATAWWRLITKRHDLLQELRGCATPGDLRRLLDRDEELRLHPLWHVEATADGWLPRTDLPPVSAAEP
jgi:hypothetical protein